MQEEERKEEKEEERKEKWKEDRESMWRGSSGKSKSRSNKKMRRMKGSRE